MTRVKSAKSTKGTKSTKGASAASSLMVRLDVQSKSYLTQAAQLRRISVSDYVREVTVSQARREVEASKDQVILLAPHEQLAFWEALHKPPKLTPSQKRLGKLMRDEAD